MYTNYNFDSLSKLFNKVFDGYYPIQSSYNYSFSSNKEKQEYTVSLYVPGVDPKNLKLKYNYDEIYILQNNNKVFIFTIEGEKSFVNVSYKFGILTFEFKIDYEDEDYEEYDDEITINC